MANKLINPIGKGAEIDLTELYVITFMNIYETIKDKSIDWEQRYDEICRYIEYFDYAADLVGGLTEEEQ